MRYLIRYDENVKALTKTKTDNWSVRQKIENIKEFRDQDIYKFVIRPLAVMMLMMESKFGFQCSNAKDDSIWICSEGCEKSNIKECIKEDHITEFHGRICFETISA